ncbi:fumarylacetoacetate hydrolase family protein [Bacillus sp. JJ1532]|uniref:2-keto-4-pentenoate hydratase n=1 Tax=unclassified Bacillus (in: firmicutes) TaxID=185979 RepID=UPI002FFE76A7
MINYKQLAEMLVSAEENNYATSCITSQLPEFNLSMGYLVQDELIQIKKNQGSTFFAYKMGITSEAKMKQMNIDQPIYGAVFDYMRVHDKGEIFIEEFIHPKVEAEIAFILGEDIEGPGVTGAEVMAKTKGIQPAFEIIDSRYENFKFKLPDVVADNTSASRVVMGNKVFDPKQFDLEKIGVTLSINGEIKASGTSADVLGNPANSVAMLANMLFCQGKGKIPKGSIIFTGGITEAILLTKGDHVTSKFEGMSEISLYIR